MVLHQLRLEVHLRLEPRALVADHGGYEYDSDYARGVADERARVVADLQKQNQLVYPSARFLANRYERGEHEEKP